jgi:hypothetical protein
MISRPRKIQFYNQARAALVALLLVCPAESLMAESTDKNILQGPTDPNIAEPSRVLVELGSAEWAEVTGEGISEPLKIGVRDGNNTGYKAISLASKRYTIRWGRDGDLEYIEKLGLQIPVLNYKTLTLEGGHRYLLQAEPHSEQMSYLWVKNKTTGYSFDDEGCLSDQGYGVKTTTGLAKDGNSDAQYQLAEWYEGSSCLGKGRPKFKSSIKKAIKWYERAAEQDLLKAQLRLALLYQEGKQINQDWSKARRWTEAAAKQGDLESALQLGTMYYEGLGVDTDLEKARYWYEIAAEGGVFQAELKLELMSN